MKADLFLFKNKNNSITSSHKFQIDKKLVRISKKLKLKKFNIKNIIKYEQKDFLLVIKKHDFKIFIINYSSFFSNLFYHVIVNKNHVLQYSDSDIS